MVSDMKYVLIIGVLLAGVLGDPYMAHAGEETPVPEFYGLYLVSDGHLVELGDALGGDRCKYIAVDSSGMLGSLCLAKSSGKQADANAYFLAYGPDWKVGSLSLYALSFQTSVKVMNVYKAGYEARPANCWFPSRQVALKRGPVSGHDDLYRLVPSEPLANGAYAITRAPWPAELSAYEAASAPGFIVDFSVGDVPMNAQLPGNSAGGPQGTNPEVRATVDISGDWGGSVSEGDGKKTDTAHLVVRSGPGASFHGWLALKAKGCTIDITSSAPEGDGILLKGTNTNKAKCMFMGHIVARPTSDGNLELSIFTWSKDKPKFRGVLKRDATNDDSTPPNDEATGSSQGGAF